MNKIYKVIWSQVANAFIAVSELASARGKTKSVSNSDGVSPSDNTQTFKLTKLALLSSIVFALPSYVTATEVNADTLNVTGTATFNGNATFNNGITTNTLTVGGKNVATEEQITNLTNQLNSKANNTELNTLKTTVEGKANQTDLTALQGTVATKASQADLTTLQATVATKANQTDVTALQNNKADKSALTTLSNTVTNNQNQFNALNTLFNTLELTSTYSGIKYFRANSTGPDATATGTNALAAGSSSKATGNNAVAVGHNAEAKDKETVAVGHNTTAKADMSITIGSGSYTEDTAKKGVAIGNKSRVGSKKDGDVTYDGGSTYVIGDGESSVAVGDNAIARGNRNIAIGKDSVTANKDADTAFAEDSIAIGTAAKTIASSKAIALGNEAKVEKKADFALAIGNQATSSAQKAVAIGPNSQAIGDSAIAVGSTARASTRAVAIGENTNAASSSSVAIGQLAQALPEKTISIGLNAGKGQASDATGTKNSHINIGEEAGENVDGQGNIGIGAGAGSNVIGKVNIALGQHAGKFIVNSPETLGENIAIGNNANTYTSATAIQRATAVGSQTKAGQDSTALGYNANASSKQSVAIGFNASIKGESGVAIGFSASSDANNVALGSSSVAKEKSATSYLTAKPSSSVVSVGNQNLDTPLLRRIVNVADGADDQDVVTVAQLKRASSDVTNNLNQLINNLPQNQNNGINYDVVPPPADSGATAGITLKQNTRISNVADAKTEKDAVNYGQMLAYVNSTTTHYFSVNDGGITRGNKDNSKATGELSMAIGQSVAAIAERSIAIGNNANAHGVGSIAIGTKYIGSAELDDGVADRSSETNAAIANNKYQYGLAIGAGANTEGHNSIAIGSLAATSNKDITKGNVDRAIALGYFARSSAEKANAIGDRAIANSLKGNAFGSEAFSGAESANAIGTLANATGTNSIAFGTHTKVTGTNSGSIGYAGVLGDTNATVVSGSGTYSLGNTNDDISANESGVFGNNNVLKAKENVRIVGNQNIIGNVTTTTPSGAAPVNELKNIQVSGYENTISSGNKLANDLSGLFVYGHHNTVANIDDPDSQEEVKIIDSTVIGANNTLNAKGNSFFVLGNNVTTTQDNSVYLGDGASAHVAKSASSSGMETYTTRTDNHSGHTFAGGKPVGVVTVGATGTERRIQNVAAGLVDAESTDAINGSQLYALTRPLRFGGDNSTISNQDSGIPAGDQNVIARSSNQAMDIKGGENNDANLTTLNDKNIGVIVRDTNSMEVKLAKNLKGLESANFGTGNDLTTINKDGITIKNPNKSDVSLTDNGLNNGGNKVTNVANGDVNSTSTDAINGSQLHEVKTVVESKLSSFTVGADKDATATGIVIDKDNARFDIVGKDNGKVTTVVEGNKVTVDLTQEAKDSLAKADSALQNVVSNDPNLTATKNGGTITLDFSDTPTFKGVTAGTGVNQVVLDDNGVNVGGKTYISNAGLNANNEVITNVASNLPVINDNTAAANQPHNGTKTQTKPNNVVITNAATVGDVLNAGFNLQTNGTATDFVKPYDTVNFADGTGTTVTSETDGNKTTFKVNVDAQKLAETAQLPVVYTKADGTKVYKHADGNFYTDPTDKTNKVELADIIASMQGADSSTTNPTTLANVQAGKKDTDAVNVSQLKGAVDALGGGAAVNPDGTIKAPTYNITNPANDSVKQANNVGDALNSLNDAVNSPLSFGGDTGADVTRKLGQKVSVVGGVTDETKLSSGNIGVVANGNDKLEVKLAKNLTGLSSAEFQDAAGNTTTVNGNGVTITPANQADPTKTVSLTKDGLNNGGNQITNVATGANTFNAPVVDGEKIKLANDGKWYKESDVGANGKPTDTATAIDPAKAAEALKATPNGGLVDFANSNPNNAATVGDLQNLGFNIGTSENGYTDQVRNNAKVDFVGDKKFITVEGSTNKETGTREVKISLKEGDIINKDEGTATIDGQPTEVVKAADGKYYKKSDIDPTTGLPFVDPKSNQPRADITPLTDDQVATIKNNGNGLVTGHKVAEALQKSGWTVGKAEAEEAFEVTYTNADEKVNPNDNVRFADGKNTVASLGTVKKLDADGKVVTTTVVKVDVDLPVDFKYTDATGKEYVKANDGKFYAKNEVGVDGFPSISAQPLTDDQVSELKKGAQLTDGVNANGQPNNGYTAQDPIQVAVEKAAKDAVAKTLQDNPQATPEQIAAAVKTATDRARVDAIKANPEAKDTVTAGTGGVNLDNVAWAEKPDQAVNKDQLDQTVNKSGFFVEQNGESTIAGKPTEKVTPNDTVNFANGANTLVTAETKRDEATGADKTTVTVNVNGLPLTYTTKDATGKDVPVAKVGDKFYQVGADGKPDMTKPADVNSLSTNLVNPAAPNGEIGKPSQLGNVANGANTFDAPVVDGEKIKLANDGKWYKESDVGANGKPTDTATAIDPAKAAEALKATPNGGLVDFEKSNPNNAATVGDLQNLGFNIGASENGYTDQVRNNAKVDFVGDKKFINVEGATKADGTREIKISLKEGDVIKPNEGIATIDGQKTEVVKTPDGNYYKKSDIDPTTGEPKAGATPLTQAQKDTVVNNGDGLVTGHKVAEALQKSGWTVGKADAAEAANVDYNNKSEKVNPDDKVSFADGKNTQVSLGTVKQEDKDGKVVTTTTVKVDVDLPIDFKYTDATGKEFVKANDGKIYAKDQVGADGKPNGNATPLADAEVAKLNKGAQLTNGLGKETPKYEVKDPIAAAAEKAVADTLAANPQATPADILKAVDAAKAAAIKANPNAKDEITKGTGGVNLDNVAWAEKPDQAVNKDQLDQTVNKSGFFVQQNGESTNGKGKPTEKVTPNDVVDFTNGANTVVTAETTRDEKTGVDTTKVSVHVNGLPLTYTTKDASGKDVPVAKVGDKFYQVGADGKPDMTKPADVNALSTNLVNPAAPNGEIGAPSQLGNVANGANTFVAPQVDGKDIKLANDGKWYAADQVDPNGSAKANAKAIDAAKAKDALGTAGNGGLADFANSNPNNVATVGDLQNLGFVIGTADDKYKDQVRNNSRVEFASGNKNATVTGSTLADGTRQVKVTISDNPVFNTIQVGGDKGPKVGSTSTGDLKVSKADGSAARITNVAPGVDNNDAVNVGQLKGAVNNINNHVNKINKDLRAGIAGATAISFLQRPNEAGKSIISVGMGSYKAESAVAVGYSRNSDNNKISIKVGAGLNSRGDVNFGGSVGYQW
ncbi:YadA-like family protein [Frederiksenia canicola]|uniref:Trimeric autotransporter adhesin n=1 Tax=Frederiksenia canicola TaxID=123824 RepID=A0AAE7C2F3_9PAST|nr:YadA-like family protein [Frederiksenia canicola]QIM65355.1 hypothetical protein A4G17_07810 [Frederiksenia canicola]RPE96209.1 trimeric autotransporter adhesin [Frederiksenia canicola]